MRVKTWGLISILIENECSSFHWYRYLSLSFPILRSVIVSRKAFSSRGGRGLYHIMAGSGRGENHSRFGRTHSNLVVAALQTGSLLSIQWARISWLCSFEWAMKSEWRKQTVLSPAISWNSPVETLSLSLPLLSTGPAESPLLSPNNQRMIKYTI